MPEASHPIKSHCRAKENVNLGQMEMPRLDNDAYIYRSPVRDPAAVPINPANLQVLRAYNLGVKEPPCGIERSPTELEACLLDCEPTR